MEIRNKQIGLPAKLAGYKKPGITPVRGSIINNMAEIKSRPAMPRLMVLCGLNGGLPFEYLMTDVMSGCLPIAKICYGNCSAADFWIEKGHDFGKKVLNEFNPDDFMASAKALPKEQKWLRQGWASDCSFTEASWKMAADAAVLLAEVGISMLIITKGYSIPSGDVQQRLADSNAELRMSLSALDTPAQMAHRIRILEDYRSKGGKSVPYLMTARYATEKLQKNQQAIVDWAVSEDYIAGEHPLRLNRDNTGLRVLAEDGIWHPKFPDQYWFGRLFDDVPNFLLPAPTHLGPEYTLSFKAFSEIKGAKIAGVDGNLPTFDQLKRGEIAHMGNLLKHATYGS